MTKYVLGIDTGGTYTDGVLLDLNTRKVIATTKALTTHHDLTVCILEALDALLPHASEKIHLVSISSTLATNAIAEGKFQPIALFLLGYDPEIINKFDMGNRFATSSYFFIEGGHTLRGEEQMPLDLNTLAQKVKEVQSEVDAIAVSGYFSPRNHAHEIRSSELIHELTDKPVVQGHQLSNQLDSICRATTATLNASLLGISQAFFVAMRSALDQRGINAPLMVMRGDGALMNIETAALRPIDTIHSGPASSAIGGQFLANAQKALVIDIGGTTTDIAIIDHGRVAILEEGTTVGEHKTSIQSANVRSFALGGDSLLTLEPGKYLKIGPSRVVPIAYLASKHPHILEELQHLAIQSTDSRVKSKQLEYWFLMREPRRTLSNPKLHKVIDLLREKPLSLQTILDKMECKHIHHFDGDILINEGYVGRSALTPTDLLHISGEYAPWNVEAAQIIAQLSAGIAGWTVDQLARKVKSDIAETIVSEVISFITGQSLQRSEGFFTPDNLGWWLYEEHLNPSHPYLGCNISLKMPIIGMGAPANIYLPRVAEILNTELILPENFQVANAIGAVAGNVMICREARLYPQFDLLCYDYINGTEQRSFESHEDAVAYAREALSKIALIDAEKAGAVEPHLEYEEIHLGAGIYTYQVKAVGNPRLSDLN